MLHPALDAEARRLADNAATSELQLRQAFARVSAVAFGAWMALDGVLFVVAGKERLTSPVFTYASEVVPAWPIPFAAAITMAGLLLVFAAMIASPMLGGVAYLLISAWQLLYCAMVWHAIAYPRPGDRPISYSPVADHGALSAVACMAGLMLLRIWWRSGRPAVLNHAS